MNVTSAESDRLRITKMKDRFKLFYKTDRSLYVPSVNPVLQNGSMDAN